MRVYAELNITCDVSELSEANQTELARWLEESVFSKFGRSPCLSFTENRETTWRYIVKMKDRK